MIEQDKLINAVVLLTAHGDRRVLNYTTSFPKVLSFYIVFAWLVLMLYADVLVLECT